MEALAATHYDALGIGRGATLAEIKAAYGRQLQEFRRQLGGGRAPPAAHLDALRAAFVTLGNPAAREAYDAHLDRQAAPAPQPEMPSKAQTQAELRPSPPSPPVTVDPYPTVAQDEDAGEARFTFTGDGGEYFRIWIVNLLLSLATLGIYSAWAKVRREQYFHRNFLLDGSGFDYHGRPLAILKGRVVAFLMVVALSAAQNVGPLAYGVALLCLVPVAPWLAVRALRFRAHNTSYRGLRFSFHGTYGQAFKVFVGYGLLTSVTFWLAFPLWYRQMRKFVLDNTRFGTAPFACQVGIGRIYGIFLLPALFLLLIVGTAIGVGAMAGAAAAAGRSRELPAIVAVLAVAFPLALLFFQAAVVPYVTARTSNAVWSATTLGPHRFQSRLPVGGFIGLTLVNWLAIIATLGLFIPWARVRVARYRAEYLLLETSGSLDRFVAGESSTATALGDEAAEMFDLDIGL